MEFFRYLKPVSYINSKIMKKIFIVILFIVSHPIYAQDYSPYLNRQKSLLSKNAQSLTIVSSYTGEGDENLNFYYLTGKDWENSVLVLSPNSEDSVWVFTDEQANDYPAKLLPRGEFASFMEEEVNAYEKINTVNNYNMVCSNLEIFRQVDHIRNINDQLVAMRAIKDSAEIEALREACKITAEGLKSAFRQIKPGVSEQELVTLMEEYFQENGSEGSSFYQASSGPHSVNVHFGATSRNTQEDEVVLFDIGAWYDNYTGDISRTIPVNGEFTREQKEIYEVVLAAQKEAIQEMKPGVPFSKVKKVAEEKLINGLHKLGLVTNVDSDWQRKFFIQHGFYHFIGLDVHDVWYDYVETSENNIYQPGMVMTMEPGVYFPKGMIDRIPERIEGQVTKDEFENFSSEIESVYSRYAGMGVRIEDDILITEEGNEILTKEVPKAIEEIEKLMN